MRVFLFSVIAAIGLLAGNVSLAASKEKATNQLTAGKCYKERATVECQNNCASCNMTIVSHLLVKGTIHIEKGAQICQLGGKDKVGFAFFRYQDKPKVSAELFSFDPISKIMNTALEKKDDGLAKATTCPK